MRFIFFKSVAMLFFVASSDLWSMDNSCSETATFKGRTKRSMLKTDVEIDAIDKRLSSFCIETADYQGLFEQIKKDISKYQLLTLDTLKLVYDKRRTSVGEKLINDAISFGQDQKCDEDIRRQFRLLPFAYSGGACALADKIESTDPKSRTTKENAFCDFKENLLAKPVSWLPDRQANGKLIVSQKRMEAMLYALRNNPLAQYKAENCFLSEAALSRHVDALKFFIDRGISANARFISPTGYFTLLGGCISNGLWRSLYPDDEASIKCLLKAGADIGKVVNTASDYTCNHVTYVIEFNGNPEAMLEKIKLLLFQLKNYDEIKGKDSEGNTALALMRSRDRRHSSFETRAAISLLKLRGVQE